MGENVAEWAYDRPDVQGTLQHPKIPAAYSWNSVTDSAYYYQGHMFYTSIDTEQKDIDRIELVQNRGSYYPPYGSVLLITCAITLERQINASVADFVGNTYNRYRSVECPVHRHFHRFAYFMVVEVW